MHKTLTTLAASAFFIITACEAEEETTAATETASETTATLTPDVLKEADYMRGKTAFQARCSACHTLADSSADIAGPGLWGVFDRVSGEKEGFEFSDVMTDAAITWTPDEVLAFISDPDGYLPGSTMNIPEAVPESLRTNLISFMYVETGKADWEAPETAFSEVQTDRSKPPSERFPSFWNHMMFNTANFRMVNKEGDEYPFEAYFQTDGTISTNVGAIGIWQFVEQNEKDMFCYAIHRLEFKTDEFVECFPVGAMAIPRFSEELWVSNPSVGVKMHGGILPGRPVEHGGQEG